MILALIENEDTRTAIQEKLGGKLQVFMDSWLSSCLGCEFSLIELKILAAAKGVDLQIDFRNHKYKNADLSDYIDKFKDAMEKHINKIDQKQVNLKNKLTALLKQFSELSDNDQRWEWVQRFLSTPLVELPNRIVLLGKYP
nr:hypothetical protein [Candidatus Sigynarchaeota archaeon]